MAYGMPNPHGLHDVLLVSFATIVTKTSAILDTKEYSRSPRRGDNQTARIKDD
ncbi:hypothetical protein Mapa_008769 [Marchantia paleacea]|nr:hypothetical protein Mapa_008769 [Marchantia paleacea]